MTSAISHDFSLPIYFDLGATFLYALTGALVAIRRRYDIVGLFVLALVSGVGGGLIRDGIFIQDGPPLAMKDERYLYVVLAGCVVAAFFSQKIDRLQKVFLIADALGLGAYAVVGVNRALNADLSVIAAIMVGVITASGGGLLRDVLVREEPLLFKPGQLYVLAALLGAMLFALLILHYHMPVETAALITVGSTFVLRLLTIIFNWKTVSVVERLMPVSISYSLSPASTDQPPVVLPEDGPNISVQPPTITPPDQNPPPPAKTKLDEQ